MEKLTLSFRARRRNSLIDGIYLEGVDVTVGIY
jgi:hypothetical protein